MNSKAPTALPREMAVLLILAGLQFAHIVDFMILMPLGPKLMRDMGITSSQFGSLVSVYTFTAGVTNLLGAFFLDRYDRKKSTLILYLGFIIGTLACGLANNFEFLFAARSIAGAFGGLISAAVLAIVGDYIPYKRRARAMGIVMASFSVASIAGVPLGLWLANHLNWQAPFFFVAGASVLFLTFFVVLIPPLTKHLSKEKQNISFAKALDNISDILSQSGPRRALMLIAFIMLSQFSIIPFLATYYVLNVKFPETFIPFIYVVGGSLTVITSPLVGKLADRFGRERIFVIFSLVVAVPLIWITHLKPGVSVAFVLALQGFFFVSTNGRFVPAMTMITSVVPSSRRGTFMSLVSCVQQVFAGIASYAAGVLIYKTSDGQLAGYGLVGWLSLLMGFVALMIGLGLEKQGVPESEILLETSTA